MRNVFLFTSIFTGIVLLLIAYPVYLFFGFKIAATVWCLLYLANLINVLKKLTKKP